MRILQEFGYNIESIHDYISRLNKDNFLKFLDKYSDVYDKVFILESVLRSDSYRQRLVFDTLSFEQFLGIFNEQKVRVSDEFLNKMIEYCLEKWKENSNRLFEFFIESNKLKLFELVKEPSKVMEFFESLDDDKLNLVWNGINSISSKNSFIERVILLQLIARGKQDIILRKFKEFSKNNDFVKSESAMHLLSLMGKSKYYPNDEEIIKFIKNSLNFSFFTDEIIEYLNRAVSDGGLLLEKILGDDELLKYVSVLSLKKLKGLEFETEDISNLSYDDLSKLFLDDKMHFENILKKLDCESFFRICNFNCLVSLNDNMMNIISQFLEKFVSYEKAIFFVDKLNFVDEEKIKIINLVYHKNINSVNKVREDIIGRNISRLLNLEMPVSDEFKSVLPDLMALPYNEDLFSKLKDVCLNIRCVEYLQFYLSQLIKYIINKNGLDVDNIEIVQKDKKSDSYAGFWIESMKEVIIYYDYFNKDSVCLDDILIFTDACFHEMRHAFQHQKMINGISIDALMCNFERILNAENRERYKKEYDNIYSEIDARIHGVYETFKFLESIDKEMAHKFLKSSTVVGKRKFLTDRRKIDSVEYFCNLINTFFNYFSSEQIIELRKECKSIELITDEFGLVLTLEEIENRLKLIKSYNTNDVSFNERDRDIKLFYIKYLHNLRYGIKNGLINIETESVGMRLG